MSGDLERYNPAPLPPRPAGTLQVWADEFISAATISAQLARTHFVPQSLWVWRERDGQKVFDVEATTAQVTAAIVTGRELGMEPMAALRSIDVINGTPALRAVALRAVLLAHGHDIWVEDATNTRATVAGRRKGSDHDQRITWTIDDAKARSLAGKPNWRAQPRNMLIARATGEVARLIAADALLGIPYTVEELEDGVDQLAADGGTVAPPPGPARRAQRARKPAAAEPPPVAEPDLDEGALPPAEPSDDPPGAEPDEPPIEGEPTDPPPRASRQQLAKLHATAGELGLNRDQRIQYAADVIDRPIESTSDLTPNEASGVIDEMLRDLAAATPDSTVVEQVVAGPGDGSGPADQEHTQTVDDWTSEQLEEWTTSWRMALAEAEDGDDVAHDLELIARLGADAGRAGMADLREQAQQSWRDRKARG